MRRITAKKTEQYSSKKHKMLLCINRSTRKSCLFDGHSGRVIALPSSSDEMQVASGRQGLAVDAYERFLSKVEQVSGYELYSINQEEFSKIATHALLSTSQLKHFDELITMFVDEKTKTTALTTT